MSSSMISPLRLAGSRLASTTAGRAITTNSIANTRALQEEEEHEAVMQHLEAMGQQHLEYRQPMLFSSPINTQRVPQQNSQPGLNLQFIRSISTSPCHQASMNSKSAMTQLADEEMRQVQREAREFWASTANQMKESRITKQSVLQKNSQSGLNLQSIRSISTSPCHQASATTQVADDDMRRVHREAIEFWISASNQMKESRITKQRPVQRQTLQNQLDSQFQSVRSLHTNIRSSESIGDTSEREELIRLHSEAMERQQQKIQSFSQITDKLNLTMINGDLSGCDADAAAILLKIDN